MAVYMQTSVRRAHVRVLNEERAVSSLFALSLIQTTHFGRLQFLEMCNRLAAQGQGDYHEGRML
jgi:hypothetical protein